MNKTEQRIAIAEFCGYVPLRVKTSPMGKFALFPENFPRWRKKGVGIVYLDDLPEYTDDLNAMHLAEKQLSAEQAFIYAGWLADLCGNSWHSATLAPIEIRVKAYLKTIRKGK
jgi:hypothetical protein